MRKIKPKTDKYMTSGPVGLKEGKSEPVYPRFRIDLEHLPEAKKWEVGKEYEIAMKVKMTGISISKFDNSAEFDIKEIESEAPDDEGEGTE